MTGRVLAVVVSFETREHTLACVESILDEQGVRVVVVDNASTDGTAEAVRERFGERVVVLANPRNAGYGAACNQGAAIDPDAPFVLFLNADTRWTPGAAAPLTAELERDPAVGVVAPRLEDDDGEVRSTVRGHPTPLALLYQHTGLRFLRIGRSAYERYRRPVVTADAEVLNGAVLMLRGSDVRALEGFDPRYFLYFEEADLCRRVGDRGQVCRLVPDAVVRHAGGASSSDVRDQALLWYLASLFQYVDRFHGRRFGILYRIVFKPLFLVRMVTDAIRDVLHLTFKPRRRTEKRAELRLAASFFTRGLFPFFTA